MTSFHPPGCKILHLDISYREWNARPYRFAPQPEFRALRVYGGIMPRNKFSLASTLVLAAMASTTLTAGTLAAAQEEVVHVFKGASIAGGSAYPNGGLIADAAGNLFGTTAADSNSCSGGGCGTAFELSPTGTGGYTQKVLHVFSMNGKRPWNPQAGLAMDASGNLYGTTLAGGLAGSGTVFQLTFANGAWTETVLHSFGASGDGASPQVGVILDAAGNIYGTTPTGGAGGSGVAFEISPKVGGGWTYKLLHSFHGPDGSSPGQLIMDSAGNLYGTTFGGGTGQGTVFKLAPTSSGTWTESLLYNFPSGGEPFTYLAMDAAGNLYGTAAGGTGGLGVAFQLSPSGSTYTESVIYDFCAIQGCPNGGTPVGLTLDGAGNLYGVSTAAGANQAGTATELSPASGGTWTAKLLHTFGNGADGALPQGLLLYSGGNLYGSSLLGGKYGYGTVFRITP
jgi:uncharacterized repeat protein (TIGR03803 family)